MKQNKKSKNSFVFIMFLAFALIVSAYFISVIINTQMEISAKENTLLNMQTQVLAQEVENEELQRALDNDSQQAYIERVAREKLGYFLPDERVYVDMSGN